MARIRSVKPELRESRIVGGWPIEVRYFWVLLWGYLDDYGRGLDLPKRIAGDCFPLESDDFGAKDVDGWLDLMTEGREGRPGPICRYTFDGTRYIHATNWGEHQKPNRPTPSRIAPCPIHDLLLEQPDDDPLSTDTRRPDYRDPDGSGQVDLLTESLTEELNGDSLPGAAVVRSRGAEEQQHARSESRSEPPRQPQHDPPAGKPAAAAERFILNATDATPAEAAAVARRIQADRRPRNLPGLVKTMAEAGDLKPLLDELRTASAKADASARLRAARDGPECEHGEPGGQALHPVSGEPLCPQCRHAARQRTS